jgi:hypothetical protein
MLLYSVDVYSREATSGPSFVTCLLSWRLVKLGPGELARYYDPGLLILARFSLILLDDRIEKGAILRPPPLLPPDT